MIARASGGVTKHRACERELAGGPDMRFLIRLSDKTSFGRLASAGINDCGGVSPVTPDHVNPEAPWPHLEQLAPASAEAGLTLTERLAVYPEYALAASRWLDPALTRRVLAEINATGFVREDGAAGR